MRGLVRQAMEEGALGVGSSLIYPPASLRRNRRTGRSDARGGALRRHVHQPHALGRRSAARKHRRADRDFRAGRARRRKSTISSRPAVRTGASWTRSSPRSKRRAPAGLSITADMYTYTAGGTGLAASMPPWVQDGGNEAMLERLRDPATVARVKREMRPAEQGLGRTSTFTQGRKASSSPAWPTRRSSRSSARPSPRSRRSRGVTPEQLVVDLVIADQGRAGAIYFLMSEDNVRRQTAIPWMSFGSDAEAAAPEGIFLKSSTHPRAYGNFARFLGKYVRDEKTVALPEAIRRLTSLPAQNLGLQRPRPAAARHGCRRRRVRPGNDRRPRDVREADAICDRRSRRVRQRHPGSQRWRGDRRHAGPICQRTGMDRLAKRRSVPDEILRQEKRTLTTARRPAYRGEPRRAFTFALGGATKGRLRTRRCSTSQL